MRNKIIPVTVAELNAHTNKVVTAYMDIASVGSGGVTETIKYYPKKVQFINATGNAVKVNIFSSEEEYQLFVADPTNYALFTIANNTTQIWTSSTILPPAFKIVVLGTATASADFTIEAICYQAK